MKLPEVDKIATTDSGIPEKVAAVDALADFGVRVQTACERVGLPRSTYYAYKKRAERPPAQQENMNENQHGL